MADGGKTEAGAWLAARDVAAWTEGGVRLFCLPHAGSGAAGFYRWKRLLAPLGVAVCPMLLPGREMRWAEEHVSDAGEMVASLVRATGPLLREPYAIFGHSMGALLAYGFAVAIQAAGLPAPRCLLVSGRNAPTLLPAHGRLHELEDEAFLRELRARYGPGPEGLMEDPELRALFLPILRADLRLVETYRQPEDAELACPVVALAGVDDPSVSTDGLRAWVGLTRGRFALHRLPGDHFYPFGAGQAELLSLIERTLTMDAGIPSQA